VQFSGEFRFDDAARIVPYLHELGITDLYASPLLKARAGSTHGYDVTDPTRLNPEIGSPDEFEELVRTLHDHQMGLLLDIVPNHMAASLENPWWFDVLEKGETSSYASFFDIDWATKRVLLPILDKPYGEALKSHELTLRVVNGRPVLQYYEQRLPIAGGGESLNLEAVARVLSQQHYRLAFWRKATDSINYRRFFDVSDLIGVRVEEDSVFQATHGFVLRLLEEGKVTGLRIDHIDGLIDPDRYLQRLPNTYVAVEKILGGDEELPPSWRTQGTTGYDFLNVLNGAFVHRPGFESLTRTFREFTRTRESPLEAFRSRKHQVMNELFAGEVNALVNRLAELARKDRHARNLTVEELKSALTEVTACLPVYRTYIHNLEVSESDRTRIQDALALASRLQESPAGTFLRRVLLLEPSWYLMDQRTAYLDFVMRWQQFTGPVMAKGLEDTAFYVQNALISVNEVGGDCHGPGSYLGIEEFHRRNLMRRDHWPYSMNTSSTHDTKRSEDVRARINVLSELPEEWALNLRRWSRMNPSDTAPDASEQVLIYQSLLGVWPISPQRLKQFITKALREAKIHTSWTRVDETYERRVMAFLDRILESPAFLRSFSRFQKKIAHFGARSSLSQLLLKITSPGVPDFDQGTEAWDLSLADPDNRRPVDFPANIAVLEQLKKRSRPSELLKTWADGRIKMYMTWKALSFRREHQNLFLHGEYIPLKTYGSHQEHIIAFARRLEKDWAIVAVPRLLAKLGRNAWDDTGIEFPPEAPRDWVNVFTEEMPNLNSFPYLLLTPDPSKK
jgi:(1->4)-alpha-D-glucan 1-alpha-D-glucosylmutase